LWAPFLLAHKAAGAASARHSLPLFIGRDEISAKARTQSRRGNALCRLIFSEDIGMGGARTGSTLKRDDYRHRALALCLGMIFSENRFTLFRIMP
jgi:hypothetical protein